MGLCLAPTGMEQKHNKAQPWEKKKKWWTMDMAEAETGSLPSGKGRLARGARVFQEATASVGLTLREFSSLSKKYG